MTRARPRTQPTGRPRAMPTMPAPARDVGTEPAAPPADVLSGLSRQNSVYRRTIAVCDQLADTALKVVDPAELTRVFAELVGKRIVLLDPAFGTRASGGTDDAPPSPYWDRSDLSVERLLHALETQRRPLRVPSVPGSSLAQGCLVTPIVIGEETLGYLLVLEEPDDPHPDDVDLLTATYAATLFALTLAHERTSAELGLRNLRTVVEALVSGHFLDADDAREKASSLGLDDSVPFRIGVIRNQSPGPVVTDDHDATHILTALAVALPGARATVRDQGIVVAIVPELPAVGDAPSETTWPEIWRELSADGTLTCGLSEPMMRPELAPVGFAQAEQALDLGQRLGRNGQLIDHQRLGIYRLLLRIGDMGQLWGFAQEVLGRLISYDAAHGGELVTTLSVYLRHQSSPKQSARVLRVHPNTVAYRAKRIEAITGLDLTDADDRLVAQVAVTIVESQMGQDPAAR